MRRRLCRSSPRRPRPPAAWAAARAGFLAARKGYLAVGLTEKADFCLRALDTLGR